MSKCSQLKHTLFIQFHQTMKRKNMSDILGGYAAYKSTTGAAKATEQTANMALIMIGFVVAILLLFVSPYLWFLFETAKGHKLVKLKNFKDYKIDTSKINKFKMYSWIAIVLAVPLTFGFGFFLDEFTRLRDITITSVSVGGGFILNLIIFFVFRSKVKEELYNKNEFNRYLDKLDELIEQPKQVMVQASAQFAKGTEKYNEVLNAELETLMSRINNEFDFSKPTLSILKNENGKILDPNYIEEPTYEESSEKNVDVNELEEVKVATTTIDEESFEKNRIHTISESTQKKPMWKKVLFTVIGLFVVIQLIGLAYALLQ